VQGNVSVKGTLTLKSTAKVTGDIIAKKLIIEPDAYLSGHCSMTIE
jgi:cytoskeletal protein CcmA (bactofilin family)